MDSYESIMMDMSLVNFWEKKQGNAILVGYEEINQWTTRISHVTNKVN